MNIKIALNSLLSYLFTSLVMSYALRLSYSSTKNKRTLLKKSQWLVRLAYNDGSKE